jgi:hypothetical protein
MDIEVTTSTDDMLEIVMRGSRKEVMSALDYGVQRAELLRICVALASQAADDRGKVDEVLRRMGKTEEAR